MGIDPGVEVRLHDEGRYVDDWRLRTTVGHGAQRAVDETRRCYRPWREYGGPA
jgi:hypothetical protein